MDGSNPRLTGLRRLPFLHILLLAGMAGALFLTHLSCPLLEPEEARYAEIPRQMLAEGRIIEPVLHGEPYYQKPPLLYWLVMLSYSILGVHDWAARLVPVLASLGTVFITWWWARRVFGSQIGFWAAAVLILSARFVYLGRMLTIDPLLTLWVTGGLATAHLAVREGPLKWRWWVVSAALTGLGLLTKGPVAVVLTVVPVVACQFLDRSSSRPSLRGLMSYLLLALAVASPWYVTMALTNPGAAVDFFWVHNLQRFVDPLDHEEPWWFFLPSLLLGTLPWSLVLVPLTCWLLMPASWRKPEAQRVPLAACPPVRGTRLLHWRTSRQWHPDWHWHHELGFALIAFSWCLLFFSLSGCKRAVYILPAFPWLSVCLAYCITAIPWKEMRWTPGLLPRKVCVAGVFAILFTGVSWFLPIYHHGYGLRSQVRRHANSEIDVYCYPKRWDSISFYLQRDDVQVFGPEQLATMISSMQSRSETLLFVRQRNVEELLAVLPPSLSFDELGPPNDRLKVGFVRPRLVIDGAANNLAA